MGQCMAGRKGGRSGTSQKINRELLLLKKLNGVQSFGERLADFLTRFFGTLVFLFVNVTLFGFWLLMNHGFLWDLQPFDPFPFELLVTIVSLEAIILSIIVLISQNRAARLADVREQVDVELDQQSLKDIELMIDKLEAIEARLARLEKGNDRSYPRGTKAF